MIKNDSKLLEALKSVKKAWFKTALANLFPKHSSVIPMFLCKLMKAWEMQGGLESSHSPFSEGADRKKVKLVAERAEMGDLSKLFSSSVQELEETLLYWLTNLPEPLLLHAELWAGRVEGNCSAFDA